MAYRDFIYQNKQDYDKKIKANEEDLLVYSKKKLDEIRETNNFAIVGETYENKKRDKKNDIGRIELNEKRFNVVDAGSHSKFLRKPEGFVEVNGGGYVAILKIRLLPFIILIGLLVAGICVGFTVGSITNNKPGDVKPEATNDPYIEPIDTDILTISGIVYYGEEPVENATVTIFQGNNEVKSTVSDKKGKYLFSKIDNGVYQVVASYGNFTAESGIVVDDMSVTKDFYLTNKNLTVKVEIADEKTPNIAVNGLTEEAEKLAQDGKFVEVKLVATRLEDSAVPAKDSVEIKKISGDTTLTFFDFSIYKEIFNLKGVSEGTTGLFETENPLEIIVPYDTSRDDGTYVFRGHNGEGKRFTELSQKPTVFEDGTYYVTKDCVYVYTKVFSTYAIGSARSGNVTKGSDTITYNSNAYVNLTTGKIEMLYQHDTDSTNDAKVEIYLKDSKNKILIANSGIIPPGNKLSTMDLLNSIKNSVSVGEYAGLMKIYYLNDGGSVATSVEIPLGIAITK